MVMESEIRAARVEKLEPIRRGPKDDKKAKFGTRKKHVVRILQDSFAVVWDQTAQRRKDEIQRCCVCGQISVWKGWKTKHEGSHAHWNGDRDQ